MEFFNPLYRKNIRNGTVKTPTISKTFRYVSAAGRKAVAVRKAVAATAAAVEISSGTINALLKLTGFKDTDTGQAISEFLFWMEMLTLSGELTVAIDAGLKKSARKIIEKEEDVAKQLDDILIEEGKTSRKFTEADKAKFWDEVYEVAEQEAKRVYKSVNGSLIEYEMLSESLLRKYIKETIDACANKGVTLKIKWIDEGHPKFRSTTLGRFGNPISSKNRNIAQLELRRPCPKITFDHERLHIDDFLEQGWQKYRNIQVETPWKHEEAVWERIYKNRNKYKEDEVMDSYGYYKDFMERNGQIPKTKNDLEKLVPKYEQLKNK